MKIRPVLCIAKHPRAFKSGEGGLVVGLVMLTPEDGLPPRVCYHLIYADGKTDYMPISDPHELIEQP